MILGIDQSLTSTGYFLLENDKFKYGIIQSNKTLNNYRRAGDISDEILFLLNKCPDITKIVLEGLPFMSRSNVTRDLAGLQYIIVRDLLDCGFTLDIDLFVVPPTKLKKFATGSGKASKQEMFEALPVAYRNSIGKVPKTQGRYDITDACWLAQYGEKE